MKKIILISGKAGSGKDTFAEELKDQLNEMNRYVLVVHYADLVKHIATVFYDWNGEKDEYGRGLLQRIGTDIFREYDQDYWINYLQGVIGVLKDRWDYVIIPDCRFPNEITCWDEYDSISVRINRNFKSSLNEKQQQHASETGLDDFEFDVNFSFVDLEDMKNQVSDFIEEKII